MQCNKSSHQIWNWSVYELVALVKSRPREEKRRWKKAKIMLNIENGCDITIWVITWNLIAMLWHGRFFFHGYSVASTMMILYMVRLLRCGGLWLGQRPLVEIDTRLRLCVCMRCVHARNVNVWYYYRIECALKLRLSKSTLLPACQIPHFNLNMIICSSTLDVEMRRREKSGKKIARWKLYTSNENCSRQCHVDTAQQCAAYCSQSR